MVTNARSNCGLQELGRTTLNKQLLESQLSEQNWFLTVLLHYIHEVNDGDSYLMTLL